MHINVKKTHLFLFLISFDQIISFTGNNRPGSMNIGPRVSAGLTTGGLAVLIAQPTDVVKVRCQAAFSNSKGARYSSTIQAYKCIANKEGMKGLWKGKISNYPK